MFLSRWSFDKIQIRSTRLFAKKTSAWRPTKHVSLSTGAAGMHGQKRCSLETLMKPIRAFLTSATRAQHRSKVSLNKIENSLFLSSLYAMWSDILFSKLDWFFSSQIQALWYHPRVVNCSSFLFIIKETLILRSI